jgi:hypothetical protein
MTIHNNGIVTGNLNVSNNITGNVIHISNNISGSNVTLSNTLTSNSVNTNSIELNGGNLTTTGTVIAKDIIIDVDKINQDNIELFILKKILARLSGKITNSDKNIILIFNPQDALN